MKAGQSQFEEAKRLLRLRNLGVAEPQSKLEGMGGRKKRKTRKVKKNRRVTRRKL